MLDRNCLVGRAINNIVSPDSALNLSPENLLIAGHLALGGGKTDLGRVAALVVLIGHNDEIVDRIGGGKKCGREFELPGRGRQWSLAGDLLLVDHQGIIGKIGPKTVNAGRTGVGKVKTDITSEVAAAAAAAAAAAVV